MFCLGLDFLAAELAAASEGLYEEPNLTQLSLEQLVNVKVRWIPPRSTCSAPPAELCRAIEQEAESGGSEKIHLHVAAAEAEYDQVKLALRHELEKVMT